MPPETHAPATPQPRDRTIRVFISSTFSDMHAERDHLVTVVFPELRERLERLGLEFFDVDLRWGVPNQGVDGERANSWAYCKQWIDRVEPFFVCILGQRYGWVPPADEIRNPDDRKAYENLSITEMEVRHAVLSGRHRRRSFFYFRGTEVPPDTPEPTFSTFADTDEAKARALKETITHTSGRPVRQYPCTWAGTAFQDLDAFGALVLEDLWSGVLRDERYVSRDVWREVLGHDPESDLLYTDETKPIPQTVWEQLVARAKPAPPDPLDAEAEQMAAFAAARLRWFQGRSRELAQLRDFIQEPGGAEQARLCVVRAVAGAGKSALLAKCAEALAGSTHLVIPHFVGATERSADVRAMLERLVAELDRQGIPHPEEPEPKQDLEHLKIRFRDRLESYDGERRIVLLIDGVNQLTDGHDLSWVPYRLGPNVRVVLSCLEEADAPGDSPQGRILEALAARQPAPAAIALQGLADGDVREIVRAFLREYCKELDDVDVATIAAMPQARNPLYLLVMLQELRSLGGEGIHLQVHDLVQNLGAERPDTVSLFTWTLERLERAFDRNPDYAANAVARWWIYLSLGRVGMAGHELRDLLERAFGPDGARIALRIERGARRYLQRRGSQWDFFHGQLREAVTRRYGPPNPAVFHRDIATYFESRWRDRDPHAISELPHHEIGGELWDELERTLCDLTFVEAKCAAGMTFALVADYGEALEALPEAQPRVQEKRELDRRIARWTAEIIAYARAWTERRERLARGEPADAAEPMLPEAPASVRMWTDEEIDAEGRRMRERPTRLDRVTQFRDFVRVECYPLAEFGARPGFVAQQAWNQAPDGTLQAAAERHLHARVAPALLRRWSTDARGAPTPALSTVLAGHRTWVSCVALTQDGRLAASASQDGSVRLWNLVTGTCARTLRAHTSEVTSVAVTPDGARAVSSGLDRTLRVWNLITGECERTLWGHTDYVNSVAMTPDGARAVSASRDRTLRVWNLTTGACERTLEGHGDEVRTVAVTPDGTRAVSSSADQSVDHGHIDFAYPLRVWNLVTGACERTLVAQSDTVEGLAVTTDGQRAVSTGIHGLRVWNLANEGGQRLIDEHAGGAKSVALTPDARRAVSKHTDGTLRVFDLQSGVCLRALVSTSGGLRTADTTADGLMAVSASEDLVMAWNLARGASERTRLLHLGPIRRLVTTSEGRRTVTAGDDGLLRLWEPSSEHPGAPLGTDKDGLGEVALTADGHRAVSVSTNGTIRDWDLASGSCQRTLKSRSSWFRSIALSRGGSWAVSLSLANTLQVWDLTGWSCIQTRRNSSLEGELLAVTTDGHTAMSTSWNGTLRVWDLASAACVQSLEGHRSKVSGVAISSDWQLAVSAGGADGTLRVWDLAKGKCTWLLRGHTDGVNGVVLTANERYAISASWDRTLRVWDLASGGCSVVARLPQQPVCLASFGPGSSVYVGTEGGDLLHFDLETN